METPEKVWRACLSLKKQYHEAGLPRRDIESIELTIMDARHVSDYNSALVQLTSILPKVGEHYHVEYAALTFYRETMVAMVRQGIMTPVYSSDKRFIAPGVLLKRMSELEEKLNIVHEPLPEVQIDEPEDETAETTTPQTEISDRVIEDETQNKAG